MKRLFVGIDVGATWLRIGLADAEGRILEKIVIRTPREGDEYAVARSIENVIREKFVSLLDSIEAIGIGTIGPLDLRRGWVINTPNLPIKNFSLGPYLVEAFKKPVYMANDCVAAVWGEHVFGAAIGKRNAVYITISTGLGGGVIVDGRLLIGKRGNAHEIGHIVVDVERKLQCGCGSYGHWEAYASGANIPRFAAYFIETQSLSSEEKESPVYKAYQDGRLSAELIYSEAYRGDRLALKIVNEINRYNVAGIESVINVYDPEVITLGGSVVLKNIELVAKPIIEHFKNAKGLVTDPPEILVTPLKDDVVLVGAVAIALKPPRELVEMLDYLKYYF